MTITSNVLGSKIQSTRVGMDAAAIRQSILEHLVHTQSRFPDVATDNDWYNALAHAVRDRLLERMMVSAKTCKANKSRTVCYLSAEFLPGPHLANNIFALGIWHEVQEAIAQLGLDFETLLEEEVEPGLGNGGLGRLAACYMDSMATLKIPAIGYGIRYEFGIFRQEIEDGWQVEKTDKWLSFGNPWEIPRPRLRFKVHFGGHTEQHTDSTGKLRVKWVPERRVIGVAYDTPVMGYGVKNTNLLRLWRSEATESFNFQAFNIGDYYGAVNEKVTSENITKVLYPNDEPEAGKRLRLEQQYFFVSCSLQDMVRIYLQSGEPLEHFHHKYSVQLNDTHPAIAIPELMRLLVDRNRMEWDMAWSVTRQTFSYTNHTLLPEALEKWPLDLIRKVLPRHLEIIYEINSRFLDEARMKLHGLDGRAGRLSIIEDGERPQVRMAHLAMVGSHKVNGVARLHSELLKQNVLSDFHYLWPDKIINVTNGVTPRRFMLLSNQPLAHLLREHIGCDWVTDLDRLRGLEGLVDDAGFQQAWQRVKRNNKERLARHALGATGLKIDPDSLLDVQVKRIHEYKRQHLNLLHIITLYNRLKDNPGLDIPPRTFVFGGKAAPGYFMAKLIIKAINSVAEVVNRDPDMQGRLRVVFFPNFNVKTAHCIYPGADVSEQISLAGKEASGTGNMKFALNGALTIGTLDGANIEIREEVGEENFFLFGMTESEVAVLQASDYRPQEYYAHDQELKQALDFLANGYFSHGDTTLFRPLVMNLLDKDPYKVLADYRSYVDCQAKISECYRDRAKWTRMSILNVARMGKFSSDRSVREYAENIWKIDPVDIGEF
ncbi:MAG: glycogen/starch/alpha-glucan phosphorylase [Gammaproteobacteria bacterium]|nr:glycogen/starch/alpha-glucan phosphorylase [Gammaproteobacteria bacterium]MBU1724756.1 glycogen/starch/alpha-glucan phosphorylase [Gammaproteobacteria bacterium]MBU2005763.1 glycogen/starch/alpha-glucan phosphorylase [Gammaproteobacteria bacterium]